VVVYYVSADLYLVDKSVLDISAPTAAAIAFASLLAAWLGYEALCRSPLGRHEAMLALAGYVFLVALTFAFTRVFSGRGRPRPRGCGSTTRSTSASTPR
jgi:uncharacterized membrane protein